MAPGLRKNPQRAQSSESTYSLMEFMAEFPDDETCLDYLWRSRYAPDGEHAVCPRCEQPRLFKRYETTQQRQSWTCTSCGLHLHPTAGTMFEKSSTPLHLWFYAAYLMTSTRCGISAKQLEREISVTYKTAWRIMRELRRAMADDSRGPLSGKVEADETYFSRSQRVGRPRPPKRSRPDERTVFGMVERGGRIVVRHIDGRRLPPSVHRSTPTSCPPRSSPTSTRPTSRSGARAMSTSGSSTRRRSTSRATFIRRP